MHTLTEEQLELLRNFKTPPPPKRKVRLKGLGRIARILDAMKDEGITSTSTWDVESRLKALNLWNDLWPTVDAGAGRTIGDCLGRRGLQLSHGPLFKNEPKMYLIPANGIDDAHCEKFGIELDEREVAHG